MPTTYWTNVSGYLTPDFWFYGGKFPWWPKPLPVAFSVVAVERMPATWGRFKSQQPAPMPKSRPQNRSGKGHPSTWCCCSSSRCLFCTRRAILPQSLLPQLTLSLLWVAHYLKHHVPFLATVTLDSKYTAVTASSCYLGPLHVLAAWET